MERYVIRKRGEGKRYLLVALTKEKTAGGEERGESPALIGSAARTKRTVRDEGSPTANHRTGVLFFQPGAV